MTKAIWAVLCKKAIIDRDTNDLSLVDVISGINLNVPIDVPGPFGVKLDSMIVSLWINDTDQEVVEEVKLYYKPVGGKEREVSYKEIVLKPNSFHRWIVRLSEGEFEAEGMHAFIIKQKAARSGKWTQVLSTPFVVTFNRSEEAEVFVKQNPQE
ncbi:MAG: hypothetical protein SH809_04925 [Rhodothermales bacterium]|nr:hypothetical protein [Rhodothermales bacterium]